MSGRTPPASRRFEVFSLLEGFAPTDGELRSFAEMELLARDPGDVLSSYTYDPGHFTVSGFVTDAALGKLVLIHHRRVGAWLQPGGHIEPYDASFMDTLARELEEETGITDYEPRRPALFDVDVHRVEAASGRPAHLHFDLRFHVVTSQRELAESDEVVDAAWVALDDVAGWTADVSVRRAVTKLRAARNSS